MAASTFDESLGTLWRWTEPVFEPPTDRDADAREFVWHMMDLPFYSDSLQPAWRAWVAGNVTEICDNRLKVLGENIIRMTQRRGIKYKTICKDVIELRGPAQVRRPLSDDPLYVEFLEKVAKLRTPRCKTSQKTALRELRGQPERLRGIAESKKQYEERRKAEHRIRRRRSRSRLLPTPTSSSMR